MKRFVLSFLLFAACLCGAMAQNDAMFVYRNDGQINAFLKADVDSMTCSHIGLDSLYHAEYVVQEVWTPDSIYRIPIEAIDSISFVTPPTVYKTGVINLEETTLLDYVTGSDSLTLKLKSNTPSDILPVTGDRLVLLGGCEALPYGFSGIVSAVNYGSDCIDVICEQAYLEDLFDSFCSVSTMYGTNDTDARYVASSGRPSRAVYNPSDININLGPFSFDATAEISANVVPDSDLAIKEGISMSLSVEPTFRVHTFLILGEGQGTYFQCSITGDINVETKASIYGGIEYNHDFDDVKVEVPVPYTAKLLNFYIVPGTFQRMSATIGASISTSRTYALGMAFDYSSIGGNMVKPSLDCPLASESTDMEGSMDGMVAAGAFLETGFDILSRDIAKVCVRGEYGWQLKGGFVFHNSDIENAGRDTKLYEYLKTTSVEIGPFGNVSLQASVMNAGGPSLSLGESAALVKKDLVPTFSNTTLSRSSGSASSVDASARMTGSCLFPVPIGFKLFDSDNNEVADYNDPSPFLTAFIDDWGKLEHNFTGLPKDREYKVYPKVRLFGLFDILASPSAELSVAHPAITDFKVTDSEYSKDAFINDGRSYDYKFDVALTAEIDNLEGVEDWGYVYKDPYGNIKRISLMQYGRSYTDTCYSYYRNEAKSSACLYAYVKYEGDPEYYDAEPYDYPLEYAVQNCPDDNHYHAIDLGLPSGTKWCCCNVGATSPEEYGGYYAWGETTEKNEYIRDNYAFYDKKNNEYINIGSDISGTEYDVAHVRMGGAWRMPTVEQQNELIEYCTSEWIQLNGVNGFLLTGPNGGQIFLPAAGCRWHDDHYYAGFYGYYWSSALSPSYDFNAYGLHFGSGGWHWDCYGRYNGYAVRAVCP